MSMPLCAVSGLPIEEGCPVVAYVVVRRRTGTIWSPLGFGFRGLQSGPHALTEVEASPLTDYTRKLLLGGLRRRDGISHSLPGDIEPGEIGRLIAENRLVWDSKHTGSFVEHRVGVMRVRTDVHRVLVVEMAGSPLSMGLHVRARNVLSVLWEARAEAGGPDGRIDDDRTYAIAGKLVKASDAMGSSSSLLSDNRDLVGGEHEADLFDATVDILHLDAGLDAVGTEWHPSRTVDGERNVGFVARFHANVALLAGHRP